jgi:predicted transcriptional regulator
MVLKDEQIAILCNIGQSIAFADNKHGQVEKLIVEGYVMKDGDLYELTPKGLKVVEEHAALLAAQRSRDSSA